MPNYPVTDNAVQVSQSITQAASLQNSGNASIYLSNESSVDTASAGLILAPGGTANWPSGVDLWAVCKRGENSVLAVLYGASGASVASVSINGPVTAQVDGPVDAVVTGTVDANILGDVNATITGPVNATVNGEVNVGGILTPVTVQGYSEVLYSNILTNVPVSNNTVVIPVGVPSRTPESYRVSISTGYPSEVSYRVGLGGLSSGSGVAGTLASPSGVGWNMAEVRSHTFTMPSGGARFISLTINTAASTWSGAVTVHAINGFVSSAETDLSEVLRTSVEVTRSGPSTGTVIYVPPSFQPLALQLYTAAFSGMGGAGVASLIPTSTTPAWERRWILPSVPGVAGESVTVFQLPASPYVRRIGFPSFSSGTLVINLGVF